MAFDKYVLAKTGSMTEAIELFTDAKANWQYFFNETTMTPAVPGTVDKVLLVKSHIVRRGPGDPNPYTRKEHDRFYARVQKQKGSARPGNTYIVEEEDPLGTGTPRERRQFAILGTDMNVIAYCKNKARFQIRLISPNGTSLVIPGASGQPTAAAATP